MVLPLFKSHYSLGRSILTLEKKDTQLTNGPDSIIDLCLDHEIKDFYLVEDSMGSFLQAYNNTKEEDLSFRFGLKINVTKDRNEKNEAALKTSSKYIIFAKNEDGYKKLIKIYSDAASKGFYYVPRTDFGVLRELWDDSSLALAIPFYDSFIFRNTLEGGECIPEFDFTEPTFLVEENELFFDSVVRNRIDSFCKGKYEIQEAQSIYYKEQQDFTAYLTLRCMNNRSTWNKPNIEHLSSDGFSFESWAEKEGVTFVPSRKHKPKLRKPEQANEEQPKPDNELKKIALEREDVHKDHASSRPLSKDYEYVGMVGEAQFAKEFNFKLDKELRPEGDGGKDFSCSLGTIDVKTARKAFNLIVEEGHVRADIHILAQYNENKETATLLGWAYKKEVLDAPKKDFGYGVINHYIPKNKLRSIESLKQKIGIKVDDFGF